MGPRLRPAIPDDVAVFSAHQADPEAARMAAFTTRDPAAHLAHWTRLLQDDTVVVRTITVDGTVIGNVVSWLQDGDRLVGYWIDRGHWGRGLATAALAEFLEVVTERPLVAHVAVDNKGSIRVLEKCGFVSTGLRRQDDDPVVEQVMVLPG